MNINNLMNWIIWGEDKSKWIPHFQKDAEIRASNPDDYSDEKYENLNSEDDIFTNQNDI